MIKKLITILLSLIIFVSCNKNVNSSKVDVPIRIVYPPELVPLMHQIKSELESEKSGTTVNIKLEQIPEYSINAANKISSGEIKSEAWIAPMTALVDYANSKIINLGAKQVSCRPIFSTPTVIATQDVFTEHFKERSGVFAWNDFIDLTVAASDQNVQSFMVSYVMGMYETTSSGLASLLQLIYLAKPDKSDGINLSNFNNEESFTRFQKFINKVGHYAQKDENIFYKAAAAQDHLFFAVTTEQQLINYNRTKPPTSKPLYALYPQEGSIWMDYSLCVSDADWVSPMQKSAIKELTDSILKKAKQKEIINFGFRSVLTDLTEADYAAFPQFGAVSPVARGTSPVIGEGVLKYIFSNPVKFKRPFAAMYVLDTSGSTESSNTLSAGKRMMRALLAANGDKDLSALMTFSEEPKLIATFDNSHGEKIKLLDVQQGTGGSALYDAIADSIRAITKDDLQSYRKIIYVFTDGNDNRSKMSLGTLIDLIRETKRHHDISLEIVALDDSKVDLADIEKIARVFNGNIYKTPVYDIDRVVVELSGAY